MEEIIENFRYKENETAEEGKKKVTKIMSMYHSGDPETKKLAMTFMLTYLEGYKISFVINTYGSYVVNYRDELMQCADIGIIKGMTVFDPEIGKPTTWFKNYMRDEINMFINTEITGGTVYYNGIIRNIKRLQGDRLKRGLDTTLDDAVMILKDKHSAKTIRDAFEIMSMQDSKDNLKDDGDVIDDGDDSFVIQPEKLYLKREEFNELYKAINMLEPEEKYTIILGSGLYKSDMRILENILKNVTHYTAFEKLIANGIEPEEALHLMGFPREAILMIKGLNKTDALRFVKIVSIGLNEDNEDDYTRIMDYLASEASQKEFRENLNDKMFEKILKSLGYNDYRDIISGKKISTTKSLKNIQDLSIKELMIGKGFLEKDVDFILSTGKEMSGAKISALVPIVEKKDVRCIDATAKKKLKKYLINNHSFSDRNRKRETSINDTVIPCMEDNIKYIQNYFDDLESVSDEMIGCDDESMEFEIVLS